MCSSDLPAKARAIDSTIKPKYIFCKGTFVAENLFLQDEIEFEKDAPRLVYLCEGEFDALAGRSEERRVGKECRL